MTSRSSWVLITSLPTGAEIGDSHVGSFYELDLKNSTGEDSVT